MGRGEQPGIGKGKFMFRQMTVGALASALAVSACANVVDGVISPSEYGAVIGRQNAPTGFGDNQNELDVAYANRIAGQGLQLALTGNVQGNSIVIFVDTRAGGAVASTLSGGYGQLGSFGGQRVDDWGNDTDQSEAENGPAGGASVLPPGFNPDFALDFNDDFGTQYLNVIDMTVPNHPSQVNRDIFLGNPTGQFAQTFNYTRDGGATPSGTVKVAMDNSNTAGVFGYDFGTPPGTLGDPDSASTGLELDMDEAFIRADEGYEIKMMAFITNGGGYFLSNQFLNGIGPVENLGEPGGTGGDPLFDARLFGANPVMVIPEPAMVGSLIMGAALLLRRRLK
jgi:hypothetical protein